MTFPSSRAFLIAACAVTAAMPMARSSAQGPIRQQGSIALPAPSARSVFAPPRHPLPSEAASAGITRFSFIVYGATRGPRDSLELQQAHGWVVDAALAKIAALAAGPDPVRFILQTGDAVLAGNRGKMLDVGFVP